ncbi:MAG: 50S ribosomal protein L1 [Candidatus Pacebacteria bacterium]|nr:50S ribosomal protein L1 [Candidatus Paceibacterota bacterium]
MSKSKLYKERLASVDRQKAYPLDEALQILKDMPECKFDETVELACRLGVDPRQSDQVVRGVLTLPQGTGKSVRVAVVASGEAAEAAKAAGADEVGFEELIDRVKEGWLEFDVLIATPAAMQSLRPLGRVLGPRGLMPNPKAGTLTDDTAVAVKEAKAGRVEYRTDRGGCVHVVIGKRSFTAEALKENAEAVVQALQHAKPDATKGAYFASVTVCSTMSPGIRIDPRSVIGA